MRGIGRCATARYSEAEINQCFNFAASRSKRTRLNLTRSREEQSAVHKAITLQISGDDRRPLHLPC